MPIGATVRLTVAVSDDRGLQGEAAPPDPTIPCVDCGGTCHLITHAPEDGIWWAGDVAAYRCADCNDRWDVELPPLE